MTVSVESFAFIRDLVARKSAIVVEPGKEYLVESRLAPVVREEQLPDIDALVRKLRADDGGRLTKRVIEAMTTNETSFFRDVHPWETLRKVILPDLAARRASKKLRIWCAAASTGQEPYTIAMVVKSHLPDLASWNVEIVATDINQTVLERARAGIFSQLEVNRGLPATMLVQHFDRVGTEWHVKPDLKKMVRFQELNLIGAAPPPTANDIVFMRNVLIYFSVEVKRAILTRVRSVIAEDGYLLLGGAESTLNVVDTFDSVRADGTIMYRPRTSRLGKAA